MSQKVQIYHILQSFFLHNNLIIILITQLMSSIQGSLFHWTRQTSAWALRLETTVCSWCLLWSSPTRLMHTHPSGTCRRRSWKRTTLRLWSFWREWWKQLVRRPENYALSLTLIISPTFVQLKQV